MTQAKRLTQRGWAILVIWNDGEEEYLHEGMNEKTARFSSRSDAIEQTKFMRMGMDGECQSINVVPFPVSGVADGGR